MAKSSTCCSVVGADVGMNEGEGAEASLSSTPRCLGKCQYCVTDDGSPAAGLIFDCDGTVLNTMEWYWPSWVEVCARHGIEITKQKFYECAGMPVFNIFEVLVRDQGIEDRFGSDEIHALVEEKKKIVQNRRDRPGTIETVVRIVKAHQGKLPMAIASSGHRADVVKGLKEHNLFGCFGAVVCFDDLKLAGGDPKPAPDTFLLAAKCLGVSPQRCVGFEDANVGMEALASAGMKAIDVRLMSGHPARDALAKANDDVALKRMNVFGDEVCITSQKLSAERLHDLVGTPKAGAISSFIGTTRDNFDGKSVTRLEYECYRPMAIKEMLKLCDACRKTFPDVLRIAIAHRTGIVPVREASVIIAASSAHRKCSIEAVHHLIDALKSSVPIWKKEMYGKEGEGEGDGVWKENAEWKTTPLA